jgi:hypothetical protein
MRRSLRPALALLIFTGIMPQACQTWALWFVGRATIRQCT